jgi:hypothetical protein
MVAAFVVLSAPKGLTLGAAHHLEREEHKVWQLASRGWRIAAAGRFNGTGFCRLGRRLVLQACQGGADLASAATSMSWRRNGLRSL